MDKEVFKFRVQNLSFGWCRVIMLINDKEITYNASYLGPNPLASFIDACVEFHIDPDDCNYYITWVKEPGQLKINLYLDEQKRLHLNIKDQDEDGQTIYGEWHESIPFNDFLSEIIREGVRVLNAFGLYGYYRSWQDHVEFPISNFIYLLGKNKESWKGDSCCTDISKELEILREQVKTHYVNEEKKFSSCSIYVESWQLQCCGDPFSVGEKVEWTGVMSRYKNAHGFIIDFDEEHHGFATHNIIGTVEKIIVERSEFPKGKREVWYNRANVIHEEIPHADGWESRIDDDETTERTLWGYIVELRDVIVSLLKEEKEENNK